MPWPFMLKSTHRAVQLENYTLRDALKSANNEVRKLRATIVEIQSGMPRVPGNTVTDLLDRLAGWVLPTGHNLGMMNWADKLQADLLDAIAEIGTVRRQRDDAIRAIKKPEAPKP